ncbi:hypothetical protein E4582_09875 [Luteimonas yindakuii]|uniref:Uncharacterized protein n=1 Tax=Luteimonas yindakuii TaxID=2565782 RepID=A0A4Z1RDY7_9GAMM|nr:hypothetical protein [Luteimonas yindakuii]TKS55038.1 hypothetical protein E4582_09875 [Luteimonas yindakuii]
MAADNENRKWAVRAQWCRWQADAIERTLTPRLEYASKCIAAISVEFLRDMARKSSEGAAH